MELVVKKGGDVTNANIKNHLLMDGTLLEILGFVTVVCN
jgi:hypothetical protein